MTQSEIIELFESEFASVKERFEIIKVLKSQRFTYDNIKNAIHISNDGEDIIWHPGVYVFYGNNMVWRIGRHFTNSRMRALQHIKANTKTKDGKYQIAHLQDISDAELILFNLKKKHIKDLHWVAALEVFFENRLSADNCIPPKRRG